MKITLETDSIEVIEEEVITKTYKVRIGDKIHNLSAKEAYNLYMQLNEKFQKEEEENHILNKIPVPVNKPNKLGYQDYDGMLIPVYFKCFASKKSQSRMGKTLHYYHYFKNNRNEYGFLIKNGITKPFVRLGDINNTKSTIRKILDVSPKDKPFKKSFFVYNRITFNNQTTKAVIDILTLEGYLKIIGDASLKILSYLVTNKVKELEFEDNIEPLKVQMTPTHK